MEIFIYLALICLAMIVVAGFGWLFGKIQHETFSIIAVVLFLIVLVCIPLSDPK